MFLPLPAWEPQAMGAVASTQQEVPGGVVWMGGACTGRGAEQGVCLLQITTFSCPVADD